VSGPHFRDYHLLLDDQAMQIFATTDTIAERVRKLGGTTLRSIGHIARLQRVTDNEASCVSAQDVLSELREDNAQVTARMQMRTRYATTTAMPPPPACSRTGSTRRRSACGSCAKPASRAERHQTQQRRPY
jgi:hypothetical protein